MVHRYFLMLGIAVMLSNASERQTLITKENNKRRTFKYPLLGNGIRSFLSFIQGTMQHNANSVVRIQEDRITIEMMKKQYGEIKKDIDEKYIGYIKNPLTFDIEKICMGTTPDNDEERLRKRKNSIDFVEAVHRSSQHSPKEAKKEYATILKTVYKKSFIKTEKFASQFEVKKKLFLEEYEGAQKAFDQQDFIEAYAAIESAQREAKLALWFLTQQKEEQMTINCMSERTSGSESYSSKENSDNELPLSLALLYKKADSFDENDF